MAGKTNPKRRKPQVRRSGVPLMVYLEKQQAGRLTDLSRDRRVTKTAIVKYAVDRLLLDLKNGQLDLPLGLEGTSKN
jgi:hypothetical protein